MKTILNEFKDEMIRQNLSEHTINNYISSVINYINYIEEGTGDFSCSEILHVDIKGYKSHLLNVKKEEPATINLRLSALNKFCNYLISIGILDNNPISKAGQVKIQKQKSCPKVLQKNQIQRFKREFYKEKDLRDIAIFELLYNTGVRVSELCDIEIDDYIISDRKGILNIREGKGKKYREIPLNNEAREAIINYLEVRPATNDKKLLLGQRGCLKRQAINKILKKYANKAGLEEEKIHPHVMRHQLGHDLIANGVDIVKVAEILGHTDINTTRIYSLPTEEEKAKTLENRGELN